MNYRKPYRRPRYQQTSFELFHTIEDLEISCGEGSKDEVSIVSADLLVSVDAEPYDSGDYDNPPSGGSVEITDVKVVSVDLYNRQFDTFLHDVTDKAFCKIAHDWLIETKWMDQSDNEEWSREELSEMGDE